MYVAHGSVTVKVSVCVFLTSSACCSFTPLCSVLWFIFSYLLFKRRQSTDNVTNMTCRKFQKICFLKFVFNNKEMIYPSLCLVWGHHLYGHNEHTKRTYIPSVIFCGWFPGCEVPCWGNLSAPAEATSFHSSPKIRMQMIPRASIKLRHKRIDDCETEAMMKRFIFSSPRRQVTLKSASLFCKVYWASLT